MGDPTKMNIKYVSSIESALRYIIQMQEERIAALTKELEHVREDNQRLVKMYLEKTAGAV